MHMFVFNVRCVCERVKCTCFVCVLCVNVSHACHTCICAGPRPTPAPHLALATISGVHSSWFSMLAALIWTLLLVSLRPGKGEEWHGTISGHRAKRTIASANLHYEERCLPVCPACYESANCAPAIVLLQQPSSRPQQPNRHTPALPSHCWLMGAVIWHRLETKMT